MYELGIVIILIGLFLSLVGYKKRSEIAWVEGWLVAAIGLVVCFIPKHDFAIKILQLLS